MVTITIIIIIIMIAIIITAVITPEMISFQIRNKTPVSHEKKRVF